MTTRPLFVKRLGHPHRWAAAATLIGAGAVALGLSLYDGGFLHRGWPLVAGLIFGVTLQRAELSFVRAWRDVIVLREGDQLFGFALAFAVAAALTLGAMLATGAETPPPGARIAPVSWLLPVSAFAFGLGSVIARGSLMVHLRRLGEGSLVAMPALLATFSGFVLAMAHWPWSYAHGLGTTPALWLPEKLGLVPTLALEVAVLGALAAVAWRYRSVERSSPRARSLPQRLLVDPWPAAPACAAVGVLAALSYAAGEPLGLTAECAAVARWLATLLGLAPRDLPGLDAGIGGLVVPLRGLGFSGHVVIVTGVIAGAFAAALASGRFSIAGMTAREAVEMAVGGLLIGWGAMTGLGTVTGAILSGLAVGALSGWVFLVFASAGIIVGLRLDPRPAVTAPQTLPPPPPMDD